MPTQEHRLAIQRGRKFLEKLCDPGRTPRVPSSVRTEARDLLRQFPHDLDFTAATTPTSNLLEKTASPQYNGAPSK